MKRIGVLAAVVFAAAFVSGAGGGTAHFDLSTRAGVTQYLAAHGIDSTGIVIQRGDRNYAGPSCPGKGWTCSNATRVVQVSKWDNDYQCTASSGGLVAAPDTCTIVQISTDGSNYARCVESSGQAVVGQACTIQQQNTTGDNNAFIHQTVDVGSGQDEAADPGEAGDNPDSVGNVRRLATVRDLSSETATQASELHQLNGSGSNVSQIQQEIHQRTSVLDATGSQSQEGHQTLVVTQGSDTGKNSSDVSQTQAQLATATGGATVTQAQNALGLGPNSDANIQQTSTLGRNVSHLFQKNKLTMRSKKIATVTETQGSTGGGLNGHVDQLSSGLSRSFAAQVERQKMIVDKFATSLTQNQFGPRACCSSQTSNPNNVFTINQRGFQDAGPNANQSDVDVGNCDSSGNCNVAQSIRQNGRTTTNTCTGPSCHTGILSSGGESTLCNVDTCPNPFGNTFTLTVAVVGGNGDGDAVVSNPAGINCGPPKNTGCTAEFAPGTQVTLTAGSSCDFGNGSWLGADNTDGNLAFLTMNDDRRVTAQYGNAC